MRVCAVRMNVCTLYICVCLCVCCVYVCGVHACSVHMYTCVLCVWCVYMCVCPCCVYLFRGVCAVCMYACMCLCVVGMCICVHVCVYLYMCVGACVWYVWVCMWGGAVVKKGEAHHTARQASCLGQLAWLPAHSPWWLPGCQPQRHHPGVPGASGHSAARTLPCSLLRCPPLCPLP